jgi:4-hydroxybenzoyl-CoA thioesterase
MKFTTERQVRFHHCDPAGIVFYPQFFYLLHEVQEDFLSHIGFPEHVLIESGKGIPIVDLKTEFLGMCRHGDPLTLSLELTRIGNTSIGMQYEIHGAARSDDSNNQTIKLRAHGVVVYSDVPNGKALAIPDNLRSALAPFLKTTRPAHDQKNSTAQLG